MPYITEEEYMMYASIGANEEGAVNRKLFSNHYFTEADEVMKLMESCGLDTWCDSVGNVHGVLRGDGDGKDIYIGSHLDTVKNGGRYDGILGVMGGIYCIRALKDQGLKLHNTIHIIGSNGEEGNNLGGTFGSRAMMGLIDCNKKGYLETAKEYGLNEAKINKAKLDASDAKCYLELHIEQGNLLEKNDCNIGIVTGIVGLQRYIVEAMGMTNHSGTTMMKYRKDALVGTAKLIAQSNEYTKAVGQNLVSTVSTMSIEPNAMAVIPNKVLMNMEIRNENERVMRDYWLHIKKIASDIKDCEFGFTPQVSKKPVYCNGTIVKTIEDICKSANVRYRIMPSGATHDGNAFALKMPIGMIFVPSKAGISHDKEEFTSWTQVEQGFHILYETLLQIDKKSLG